MRCSNVWHDISQHAIAKSISVYKTEQINLVQNSIQTQQQTITSVLKREFAKLFYFYV